MYTQLSLCDEWGDSYIQFADPTLTLAPKNRLSWYLGTPAIDPDDWMERVTRIAMNAACANHVITSGASGGGYTALRFTARFEHAVALAINPQTDVFRYARGPLGQTLSVAWPGWTRERVLAEAAHRFRAADVYANPDRNRGNLIHYVQNVGDQAHVINHLTPFLAEVGAEPQAFSALRGQMTISRPFNGTGHRGLEVPWWRAEATFAQTRLVHRPGSARDESLFVDPGTAAPRSAVRSHNTKFAATTTWSSEPVIVQNPKEPDR